jgi:hypothetical protein
MNVYCLYVTKTIEYEYENTDKYFFFEQKDVDDFKEEYLKKNKRSDGSFIPNITSIDFEQDLLSLNELKEVATIADIEELTGFTIDISGYFLKDK